MPRFETLGVNEGLSQNSVYSIFQDREGYMWFGTNDGLNRYDGTEIKIFKYPDDLRDPSNSNYVGNMREDENGNIWYSNETGIYFYNRLSQKIVRARFFLKNEFPSNYLKVVTLQSGIIYLDNSLTGIIAYNIKSHELIRYPFPGAIKNFNGYEQPINYPSAFHNQKIYVNGFTHKGLQVFDIAAKKFAAYMPRRDINSISFGLSFKYFIKTDKILVADDDGKFVDTIQYAEKGRYFHFYSVIEDNYHHVWITTISNGILMYEPSTKKITVFSHDNTKNYSMPVNAITAVYNDRENNLWVGTDGGGVSKLDTKPKKFNKFPLNERAYPLMNDYFTKCIYDDNHEHIYFGTLSNGLCIFNKATGRLKQLKNIQGNAHTIQSNTVSAIFCDSGQHIWVASSMGVSIFKDGAFTRVPIRNTPALQSWNNLVNHFYQLGNGKIVAAARNGLICFKNTAAGFAGSYIIKSGYEISDISEDDDHQLWIGCPGHGLQRITLCADSIMVNEQYFEGTNIRSLHRDEKNKNTLWLCTVKGLIRLDCKTKKFRVYNQSDGIANNYIYGALEDDGHNMWLSTNSGISYFNRQDNSFKNYSAKDGLQSNEFNSGAYFKPASGTLYFGGVKGFNWFNPREQTTKKSSPLLGITSASIDNESVLNNSVFFSANKVIIPYNKKTVSFRFAVLDYTLPRANSIEYKLEGLENKWYRTEDKEIRYSNLAPGFYTLKVHAINSSDTIGADTNIKLIVSPPFWKTKVFTLLMIFLLLLALVSITVYISQKKLKQKLVIYERQKEMERERERISREMHDEIGAGLTQITLMSESIRKKSGKNEKELSDIAETGRKMVASMGEIIWSMNPSTDAMSDFFAYLRENIYKLLEYSDIEPLICFPDDGTNLVLNADQKRNLLLIVKEAVNNAIKYSEASEITVKGNLADKGLLLLVADNGIGFDSEKPTSGNGLKNIRKRVSDLEGTISIQSGLGKGSTTFQFFIPLKSHF